MYPIDVCFGARIENQIYPNNYPDIAGCEGKLPAIYGFLSIRTLKDELPAISGIGSRYSRKFIREVSDFFTVLSSIIIYQLASLGPSLPTKLKFQLKFQLRPRLLLYSCSVLVVPVPVVVP